MLYQFPADLRIVDRGPSPRNDRRLYDSAVSVESLWSRVPSKPGFVFNILSGFHRLCKLLWNL